MGGIEAMKRLSDLERTYLFLIGTIGGSYIPSSYADPEAIAILNRLVRAKCLMVEATDDGARYHLTRKGREEGSGDGPDKVREVFGWL